MKKLLFCFAFIVFPFLIFAQTSKWEVVIGGSGNDHPYCMVQTKDGGYAATGRTTSFGDTIYDNVYLVKIDSSGNLQWARSMGGNAQTDVGYALIQTKDKGYAVAGYTLCYGAGQEDVYVLKFDSSGNLQWTRTVGGVDDDFGSGIIQTSDGGYLIDGSTNSYTAGSNNIYVVKLDSAGNLKWTKSYGGVGDILAFNMVQTTDRGYAIVGSGDSVNAESLHVYVIKIDSAGNLLWTQSVGGTGENIGDAIAPTHDGGVVVTGWTTSYGAGQQDMYVVKLDSTGSLQWTKTIGGKFNEYGNGIIQSADKGYLIAGGSNSFYDSLYSDTYLVKLDSLGNLIWTKVYPEPSYSYGSWLVQTNSGYTVLGSRNDSTGDSHFLFFTMDTAGNTCEPPYTGGTIDSGGMASRWGYITYLNGGTAHNGGIVTAGGIHTTLCSKIVTSNYREDSPLNELKLYPNPCSNMLNIDFENESDLSAIQITDITGRVLFTDHSQLTADHFSIDVSSLNAGMYFIRIHSVSGIDIKKFIKE